MRWKKFSKVKNINDKGFFIMIKVIILSIMNNKKN